MKAQIFFAAVLASAGLCPAGLEVATFDADVTPEVGQLLTYDRMVGVGEQSLRARGYVLTGAGEPIVVCAVDWIGVANKAHDVFRDALAAAAGTTRERVALQAVHFHDAPVADFTADELLREAGRDAGEFDRKITQPGIERTAQAVRAAMQDRQPVSHVSIGRADVEKVASNRHIMGPDGKVRAMRFSACGDPEVRAEPEGLIDPKVTVIGLWNGEQAVVVSCYYATHPMSYYRTGMANPDFPGMARLLREVALPGVRHVYFTGAAGNVAAGKYNDGAQANRPVLAKRLEEGIRRAWESSKKEELGAESVGWGVEYVALQPNPAMNLEGLRARMADESTKPAALGGIAFRLAWVRRCEEGHKIDISCLRLGSARILHLPGEPFVEYQLGAQDMRPELTVTMAGYGDYGTEYIGTEEAYSQGSYEVGASFVAPDSERLITEAMRKLLKEE